MGTAIPPQPFFPLSARMQNETLNFSCLKFNSSGKGLYCTKDKNLSSRYQREVCHAHVHLQPRAQLGILILGSQDFSVPVIIYKAY